ncbi:hypothetical protein [Streptomyces sp. NPDC093589]|uniref:hypothetical protein n=1 Tax=Streptomyces sp. NPDC093589 TaxID=3366043 RepID=UPI0038170267
MKALTIRQPWSGAIAHQSKRVENRTWKLPQKFVGERVLLHAAAQPDKTATVSGPNLDVFGAVIAVIRFTGYHFDTGTDPCCSEWAFPNVYHWTIDHDVTVLPEPVPATGALSFWTPDPHVLAAVDAQTAVAQ